MKSDFSVSEEEEKRIAERLEWFQDMKFGFFTHWGAYSQWGCIESWPLVEVDQWARSDDLKPWIERKKDIEKFKRDYWNLNKTFNPTNFDPKKWVDAAKYAGMRYFVFTTKHHDGFCMFDTKLTDYRITAPDCPFSKNPKSNVALELFEKFRSEGFGIGAYFSKADWNSPYYWSPDAPAKTRNPNYNTKENPEKWGKFVEFVHGQIEELMTGYGHIDVLWLDAGQVRPPDQDIQMDKLAAMTRKHQPGLIVVDRTVGGKYENYRTPEQEVPDKPPDYIWESCLTMANQWSYKPNDDYKSTRKLIHLLVDIVSKGGNLLLNVGPQPDGELPKTAISRLNEIGDWMEVNSEAIYSTRPIPPYKEGKIALTKGKDAIYAIYMAETGERNIPKYIDLSNLSLPKVKKVELLGFTKQLKWNSKNAGIVIEVPTSAMEDPPCDYAFAFKIG